MTTIAAIIELINNLFSAFKKQKKEEKAKDYEKDINDIRDNPIAYAKRLHGRDSGEADKLLHKASF